MLIPLLAHASGGSKPLCGDDKPGPTNLGTQFLLCFEQNYMDDTTSEIDAYLEIYLATLDEPATITITCNAYPAMNKVFNLAARSSQVYRITDDTLHYTGGLVGSLHDLWITTSEVVDQRVVQVNASAPIACYGMNNKQYTADAFLALPQSSAGTDYRILSYQNSIISGNPNMPSQFAVAAWTDTKVTITPACTTVGHPAKLPFTISLKKGECVQVQTDPSIPGLDLTGSIVQADHLVAVYAGNARTEIPNNYTTDGGGTSRDLLLEAMPPVSTWGRIFALSAIDITASQKDPLGDLVRVLALNSNTKVTVNGNPWSTLAANGFADTLILGAALIETSGPALVGEYFHTNTSAGSSMGPSDPSLAIVPPIDETYNDYTFFASTDVTSFSSVQKVIIATDVAAQNSIVYDGITLPGAFFTPLPLSSSGRALAILEYGPVSPGPHHIYTTLPPDKGFTILSYGTGPVISYGYTAGQLLLPHRTVFINDPHTLEMAEGHHINRVDFRNISMDPAYLDSAVFTPDRFEDVQLGIHSKENVALDIGRMPVAAEASLHLVPRIPLTAPVPGTIRIYAHTPSWSRMEPAEAPLTLYPDAAAGVQGTTDEQFSVSSYPNPFSMFTNIRFTLPGSGDVTVRLYDQLGRVVRTIASGEFGAGPYSLRLERRNLSPGFYTCEIVSERLNIKQRVAIVAEE